VTATTTTMGRTRAMLLGGWLLAAADETGRCKKGELGTRLVSPNASNDRDWRKRERTAVRFFAQV